MATPMTATQMLTALQREGVAVAQPYSGWRTHNRNHIGRWGGVNGIVIHHTAGSNSRTLCYYGTASLPGPLCHAHLEKSGKLNMIGHGRANHAGSFAANAHAAVVNERATHPRPDASEPIDGNAHYYGIEIENLGNGRDPYPAKQYDAAVRWAAAICRFYGWSADSVIGHKEGTRRKIDPKGPVGGASGPDFDMDKFRRDVDARLTKKADAPSGSTPDNRTESDVPKTIDRKDAKDGSRGSEWQTLSVSGTTMVPKGATAYDVDVFVTASAPAGGTLQGRFVHHFADGTTGKTAIVERITTGGKTYADFGAKGALANGARVTFELCYYGVAGERAEISHARVRGLYWEG